MKKDVLKNFAKFTGKHLYQSFFFNKVAHLRPATLLKKRLWHSCFPVNSAKFLRTPFFYRTPLVAASTSLKRPLYRSGVMSANCQMCSFLGKFLQSIGVYIIRIAGCSKIFKISSIM